MSDPAATARLAKFFAEIKISQFIDCEEVTVNTRGFAGDTPLKIAVVRDDVQIVTDLLEAGADPNLPGEDDCIPLHHAADHGHLEIIRLLLARGASTSARDIYGKTAAEIARMLGHKEAHALLVSKGT